jgi:hypothetical protein
MSLAKRVSRAAMAYKSGARRTAALKGKARTKQQTGETRSGLLATKKRSFGKNREKSNKGKPPEHAKAYGQRGEKPEGKKHAGTLGSRWGKFSSKVQDRREAKAAEKQRHRRRWEEKKASGNRDRR